MKSIFPAALAVIGACALFTFSTIDQSHAGAGAARALERLEGLKEGTRRANRLMGVNTRRVPWCGHAVKYAVQKAGKKPAKHYAAARSWESWGRRVSKSSIRRGDVIVFRSGYSRSGRHVAVATAVKGNKVKVCGGNTRDRVHCGWRPKSRIITVRR
ncbi:CHAP domain-containing protein [Pseudahrensia aquimaris]|uniref:CHAP domain-containing protein n=1 Tax=Pseudahrensia aquimaris TaxID=744461 RepID=A0ABW3FKS0_9HYPH